MDDTGIVSRPEISEAAVGATVKAAVEHARGMGTPKIAQAALAALGD